MSVRITYETSVTGYFKGLNTRIMSFLKSNGICFFIQTSYISEKETRITHILIEGESAKLFVVKEALDARLKHLYPGIEIAEWTEKRSTTLLAQYLLLPTAGCKSPTSTELIDKAQGNTKKLSRWKEIVASGFNTTTGLLRDPDYAYSAAQSALYEVPKAISVTYKGITAVVDTACCSTWMNFVALLKENKDLAIEKDKEIERVYSLVGNDKAFVRDINLLKEGVRYYVEENVKEVVVDPKMVEFYEKLKSEQELDDRNIQVIKNAFDAQQVKFKQLMATGQTKMTDEKLEEEVGIKAYGLRTAILSVIETLTTK